MRHFRTRDFGRAKTFEEKRWYGAGIPQRFWKDEFDVQPTTLVFTKKDGTPGILSPEAQASWVQKLMMPNELKKQYFYIIGSLPTDEKAMMVAARTVKCALLAGMRVHMFNVAGSDYPDEKDDLVVMYNLSEAIYTPERMYKVRDFVVENEDRFRILVVEGNPVNFANNVLRKIPDVVLAYEGPLLVQKTLGGAW